MRCGALKMSGKIGPMLCDLVYMTVYDIHYYDYRATILDYQLCIMQDDQRLITTHMYTS